MPTYAISFSLAGAAVLVSLVLDRRRTVVGLRRGLKMLVGVLPPLLNVFVAISVLLYVVPPGAIGDYLGSSAGAWAVGAAALIGSITLIPGIVAYPLAAVLVKQGASYMTVATFITTLMMVGVVTLPLEAKDLAQ